MPDKDHREVALFGHANKVAGYLANLGGHAGCAVEVAVSDGLNRVNHEKVWGDRIDLAENACEVGFGGEVEAVNNCARSLCPEAYLANRFFARNIKHPETAFGSVGCDLEQKGGFSDARFARQQNYGSRDKPTAEHAVEFANSSWPGGDVFG